MWLFSFSFLFCTFVFGNQQSSDLQPSNVAEDDRQSCVAVDLFTNGPLYKIEIGPSRSVLLGPSCSVRLGYAAIALRCMNVMPCMMPLFETLMTQILAVFFDRVVVFSR